jgi:hypothetical protein
MTYLQKVLLFFLSQINSFKKKIHIVWRTCKNPEYTKFIETVIDIKFCQKSSQVQPRIFQSPKNHPKPSIPRIHQFQIPQNPISLKQHSPLIYVTFSKIKILKNFHYISCLVGTTKKNIKTRKHISRIIEKINNKFGVSLFVL